MPSQHRADDSVIMELKATIVQLESDSNDDQFHESDSLESLDILKQSLQDIYDKEEKDRAVKALAKYNLEGEKTY